MFNPKVTHHLKWVQFISIVCAIDESNELDCNLPNVWITQMTDRNTFSAENNISKFYDI